MMTEDKIKTFINNTTLKKYHYDWFECINFIYSGSEETNNLTNETIKVIKEIRKAIKDDPLIESLKIINNTEFSKRVVIDLKWQWGSCINKSIIGPKETYLKSLFQNTLPIKYIIFSEAPMLTWEKSKEPFSNYIFKDVSISGSYRSAPYKAFDGTKKKVNNIDIIKTFCNERVAFIDLIDLPLPIDTKLRCKWNYKIKINCKPLTIIFLENALLNFLKEMNKYNIVLAEDIDFAFMMPPQTAFGIIEYIRDYGEIKIEDNEKFIKINYLKATECNNIHTKKVFGNLKEEILPLYARIAMGGSNNPSDNLLKRALNIH